MLRMATFRFKQFAIQQDRCAMKIGTDGVLLGAWADLARASRVLDIGTGTGVLALMAAQRNPAAAVHAVELDPDAAAQAQENAAQSPWADRLIVQQQAIQAFAQTPLVASYDAILCNPPYYPSAQHSPIAATSRALARQTDQLHFDALLDAAARLLSPEGRFSLVLPVREGEQLLALALRQGWHLSRRTAVLPREGKPANRLLLELMRCPVSLSEETLALRQADASLPYKESFTAHFRALHRDFLLFL